MQSTVYLLYLDGVRLDPDISLASKLEGWLVFRRKRPGNGMPYHHAYLLPEKDAADGRRLRELQHCDLTVINGGIRLVGKDWDANHHHKKQAWWIVPAAGLPQPQPHGAPEGTS